MALFQNRGPCIKIGYRKIGDRNIGDRKIGDPKIVARKIGDRKIVARKIGDRKIGDPNIGARKIGDRKNTEKIPKKYRNIKIGDRKKSSDFNDFFLQIFGFFPILSHFMYVI